MATGRRGNQRAPAGTAARRGRCLLLLLLGLGLAAAPEGATVLAGRPQVQVFTDREGLRQNSVEALALDDQGYAWIGTQDGAMRYDGNAWTAVDMPRARRSNWVTALAFIPGGARWFGTNNAGIARWDGAWTVFDTSSGLPSDGIYCLATGAGTVWAGTALGPARWTGTRWQALVKDEAWTHGPVRALLVRGTPRQPEVWVGTDGGLGCLQGGAWRWLGRAGGLPTAMVTSLLEGDPKEGRPQLWVGTQNGLASGEPGRWTVWGPREGLPHPSVACLRRTVGRDGRSVLWVGTEGGVVRWDGAHRRTWGRSQGLVSPVVRSLMVQVAPSGRETVWAGTFGGLVRFTEGTWASLDAQEGLPDSLVFSFHEEAATRTLWFGTSRGLVSFRQGVWTAFGPVQGLPRMTVFSLSGDGGGGLWVGTRGEGLFRLEGGRARPVPGLPDAFVYAVHASRDGDGVPVVWVGTRAGLSKWRAGAWTHFDAKQRVPRALVSGIAEVKDASGRPQIWVGTRTSGLGVLEPGRDAFTWFGGGSGLVDPRVMHLLAVSEVGRSRVWVSTQGGLQAFRTSPPGPTDEAYGTASTPALPGDVVYTAQQGRDGSLYAFTSRGVWRLGPPTPEGRVAQTFTTGDGLPSNGCVQGASMVDSGGRVWAGTVLGVAFLDPAATFVDAEPKPLYLASARSSDQDLDPAGPWRLGWRSRHLQVRFSLLSYHREGDTRFRSQLVGLEEEPSLWLASPEREFVSLPPGAYRLRFWARDHAGNVSGPKEVALTVQAPPWVQWWAVLGYVVLLTLGVAGVVLWRVASLQRQNVRLADRVRRATEEVHRQNETLGRINQHLGRLNEEKSRMLGIAAHDLRNPLSGIALYADALAEREGDGDALSPARRIRKLALDMGQLIERLLNSSRIDAGALSLHMEAVDPVLLLQELRERHAAAAAAKGLALELDLPAGPLEPLLADPFHLMEALDNLVSNALKFMDPGPPARKVVLRARPGFLEVQDEGPGFTEDDQAHAFERFRRLSARPTRGEGSTGLGLSIVKALVEAMGGEIHLHSVPGQGATFRISLGRA